jgi:hypothetical protein
MRVFAMSILWIIFGVSLCGLCGLYFLKRFEGGVARFFPALRRRADFVAMKVIRTFRTIVLPDIEVKISNGLRRAATMISTAASRVTAAARQKFYVRLRALFESFVRGSQTPLTRGSASIYLQRITDAKRTVDTKLTEESSANTLVLEVAPVEESALESPAGS